MVPKPQCTVSDGEGGRKQNPEYSRWYRKQNIDKISARHSAYFQKHKGSPRMLEYSRKSKRKHRVANRRKGRAYYRANKAQTLEKHKVYRKQPHVKLRMQKYSKDLSKKQSDRNARCYQKARITRQKGKTTKRIPGFVYFFKCITPGYYKAGCTQSWKKRKRAFSGPAAVERLYFVRPVPDKFYAETHLKIFLENAGYRPVSKSNRARICDWFMLDKDFTSVGTQC